MKKPSAGDGPVAKRWLTRPRIGWREWLTLPDLGVGAIKAKVDTGARTSSLHAVRIKPFQRRGEPMVRFEIHTMQRTTRRTVIAEAPVVDERLVRNSGGHQEHRLVILTRIELQGDSWLTEVTLAQRDEMGFRMLLGRQDLRGRFLVDSGASYVSGGARHARPTTGVRPRKRLTAKSGGDRVERPRDEALAPVLKKKKKKKKNPMQLSSQRTKDESWKSERKPPTRPTRKIKKTRRSSPPAPPERVPD